MFGRKQANSDTKAQANEPFTYIHKGTLLEGNLSVKGRVRVHGTVRGNVKVAGILEVAEGGLIEGQIIQVEEAIIIGTVKSNIEARGKIEIWKKGTLEGDVRASALDIEEGALFTGRSEMKPSGANAAAPAIPSVTAGTVKKEKKLEPAK